MTLQTLKKRSDFLAVQKQGRKWVSRGLILEVLEKDRPHMRVGFTVSKRVDKRAVGRSRIKRRLREVARAVLPVQADPSCDYVIIGRHLTQDRSYETLCRDLTWCLKKMGYLKHDTAHKDSQCV